MPDTDDPTAGPSTERQSTSPPGNTIRHRGGLDEVVTDRIQHEVHTAHQLQQQETEVKKAQLRQATPHVYPGAVLNGSLLLCGLLLFFWALLFRVVSLAVIAAPSIVCSVLVIQFLKVITPVKLSSNWPHLVLGLFLIPVAVTNFLLSMFPIVNIIFLLKYRFARTATDRSSAMEEIEYVLRYSTGGYVIVLILCICTGAFAALTCVFVLAARPGVMSGKADVPTLWLPAEEKETESADGHL